ncbi:MAG: hypothetical protein ACYCZQ_14440 [Burkholderiales bacterium]
MSRLWCDRLYLAIAPDRIVLVRTHGRLRPRVVAKAIVPVAHAASGWEPAIAALAPLLADRQWQGTEVRAVLSNDFVRYQLIPWSDAVANAEEREAYVRQSFAQVYGDDTAQWAYAVSQAGQGTAWLASAVERALLARLETAVESARSKLVSAVPHLMPTFNRARRALKHKDMWFVQAEKHRLLLMLILDGRWRIVSSRQIQEEQWQAQLPLLLEREWCLKGTGQTVPRTVVISAPEAHQAALDGASKWVFHWLRLASRHGFSGRAGAPYAMALGR